MWQLAAFCDGSVRTVQGNRLGSLFENKFREASFFNNLEPVDPNGTGYQGQVMVVDGKGNGIIAVLIGLLTPARTGAGVSLDGIVVAPEGTGFLAGAPGTGRATINWGDGTMTGPFDASLSLKPFMRRVRSNATRSDWSATVSVARAGKRDACAPVYISKQF